MTKQPEKLDNQIKIGTTLATEWLKIKDAAETRIRQQKIGIEIDELIVKHANEKITKEEAENKPIILDA